MSARYPAWTVGRGSRHDRGGDDGEQGGEDLGAAVVAVGPGVGPEQSLSAVRCGWSQRTPEREAQPGGGRVGVAPQPLHLAGQGRGPDPAESGRMSSRSRRPPGRAVDRRPPGGGTPSGRAPPASPAAGAAPAAAGSRRIALQPLGDDASAGRRAGRRPARPVGGPTGRGTPRTGRPAPSRSYASLTICRCRSARRRGRGTPGRAPPGRAR